MRVSDPLSPGIIMNLSSLVSENLPAVSPLNDTKMRAIEKKFPRLYDPVDLCLKHGKGLGGNKAIASVQPSALI